MQEAVKQAGRKREAGRHSVSVKSGSQQTHMLSGFGLEFRCHQYYTADDCTQPSISVVAVGGKGGEYPLSVLAWGVSFSYVTGNTYWLGKSG